MFPYVKEEYAAIAAEAEKSQEASRPTFSALSNQNSAAITMSPQVPRRTFVLPTRLNSFGF